MTHVFLLLIPLRSESPTYIETAKALKGSDRRQFMARIVKSLGYGGQSYAAREFGWGRNTIAKGTGELESGIPIGRIKKNNRIMPCYLTSL